MASEKKQCNALHRWFCFRQRKSVLFAHMPCPHLWPDVVTAHSFKQKHRQYKTGYTQASHKIRRMVLTENLFQLLTMQSLANIWKKSWQIYLHWIISSWWSIITYNINNPLLLGVVKQVECTENSYANLPSTKPIQPELSFILLVVAGHSAQIKNASVRVD